MYAQGLRNVLNIFLVSYFYNQTIVVYTYVKNNWKIMIESLHLFKKLWCTSLIIIALCFLLQLYVGHCDIF